MIRARTQWFNDPRAFPSDRIPEGALERAWMERVEHQRSARSIRPQATGIAWRSLGPAPDGRVPYQFTGRVRAVAVHPLDPTIIYVGAASGGVWKSTNDGASWAPVSDAQCSLNIGALAIDPANPRIIYAGTGEPSQSNGCGILRSTDDGQTWAKLDGSGLPSFRTYRILIDPVTAGSTDRTTLYIASDQGAYLSSDGGRTFRKLALPTGGVELTMDPSNPRTLYAGFQRAVDTTGVFKSVDGGTTWSELTAGLPTGVGTATIALDPRVPGTVYVALATRTQNSLLGFFRSLDGGQTWTALGARGTRPGCPSQGRAASDLTVSSAFSWYSSALLVHPQASGVLYFGEKYFWRSTDGGASWIDITQTPSACLSADGISPDLHVDQHVIAFDPRGRLYLANDGGIHRSPNGGDTWESLNTNLSLRQFYPGTSLHPTNPSIIFAGAQDDAVLRYTDGSWAAVQGGDGGFTAIDPLSPSTVYAEVQWPFLVRSDRNGDPGSFVRKMTGLDTSDTAAFIPPLVIDQTAPNRLAMATNKVYLSDDKAEHWRPMSTSLSQGFFKTVAFAPTNGAVMWAGSSQGVVWMTESSGAAWTDVSRGLPTRAVTDIAVASGSGRTAYVTVSAFGTPHVWKTVAGGGSWQAISTGLPDAPANTLVIDRDPGTLYVGTDVGVYRTVDDGAHWSVFSDDLPNVPVMELVENVRLGLLVAATYGRGLYVIGGLCSSSIEPPVKAVAAGGGDVQVSVTSPCGWIVQVASSAFPWIHLTSSATASGNATVTFRIDANPGAARVGQVNIAAQVLVIQQSGK